MVRVMQTSQKYLRTTSIDYLSIILCFSHLLHNILFLSFQEDGDIGAPLFTPASYRIRGILVHVSNRRYMPGLYVTVLYHMQWIEDAKADRQYENLTRRVFTRSSTHEPSFTPNFMPELHV